MNSFLITVFNSQSFYQQWRTLLFFFWPRTRPSSRGQSRGLQIEQMIVLTAAIWSFWFSWLSSWSCCCCCCCWKLEVIHYAVFLLSALVSLISFIIFFFFFFFECRVLTKDEIVSVLISLVRKKKNEWVKKNGVRTKRTLETCLTRWHLFGFPFSMIKNQVTRVLSKSIW